MSRKVVASQNVSRMCMVCGRDNPLSLKARFYDLEGGELLGVFDVRVFCALDLREPARGRRALARQHDLIVRREAREADQHRLDLRRIDVDATDDEHVVGATLDLAHAPHRATAGAFFAIEDNAVSGAVAQQGHPFPRQGGKDKFTHLAVAERFADEGAGWLHLVDLDRAFGEGDNAALLGRVIAGLGGRLRVQVGGGFRTLEAIESMLELGAARVVIGTAAVRSPELVPAAVERAGSGRLAVGIDARAGMVAIRGWREETGERATDVAARVIAQGIRTLVYTDVARDGMLEGPDLAGAVALQALGADVIASGGVASLEDLRRARDAGLAGAIVGRAIYEGRFTVGAAVAAVSA